MPKKYTPSKGKSQLPSTKKFVAESQKQFKRELTEKWRLLKRIGAYQSKEAAAQSRLTKSRIRAIEKKFREINSLKTLERGRTVRPIQLIKLTTKSGKVKIRYDFTPNFAFVRTKKKTKITEGIRRTKKGFIIQKSNKGAKVSVNKKGEILEKIGRTVRRKTRYKGKDLLKLLDQFDAGTYPFKKNDLIVFHIWGQPNKVVKDDESGARFISNYIKNVLRTMPPAVEAKFLEASYIEFIESTGEDNDFLETEN